MFLGYVHTKTTTIWRIYDFSCNRAVECSNTIFGEDQNAYKAISLDNSSTRGDAPAEAIDFPVSKFEVLDESEKNNQKIKKSKSHS
jgi:hypothetical protein